MKFQKFTALLLAVLLVLSLAACEIGRAHV